jgi:GTP-binding protein Era
MTRKCGYIAIVGRPNAGKSTLVNALVGTKIAIVTHKVQTTRTRLLGIALQDQSQLLLLDTPGLFQPDRPLAEAMVKSAWQAAEDADLICLIVDISRDNLVEEKGLLKELVDKGHSPILIFNKIDAVTHKDLLEKVASFDIPTNIKKVFMISALNSNGIDDLKKTLTDSVPEGPWLFPEDQISDVSMRVIAQDVTREKLFINLHQELPYSLTVRTDAWEQFDNGSIKISQTIFVERDNQKSIVLGKNGVKIKRVRELAQKELQEILDTKVHLFLFVKVLPRWTEKPSLFETVGLDFKS